MFAIIRLGNQQFKVQAGDFVRGACLKSSKETVELEVISLDSKAGLLIEPSELKTAKVKAKILRQGLTKKVLVFKKKRRKGYRKTRGHRQKFTELQILEIALGSTKSSIDPSKIVASKKTELRSAKNPKVKKVKNLKNSKKAAAPTATTKKKDTDKKTTQEKETKSKKI